MKRTMYSLAIAIFAATFISLGASCLAIAQEDGGNAVKPIPRGEWWMQRHAQKLAEVKKGGQELVFIGDSITHGWEGGGKVAEV